MTEVTRFRGVILKVREVTVLTMVTVTVQLNGIMRVRWMEMESGSTIPYEGQYLHDVDILFVPTSTARVLQPGVREPGGVHAQHAGVGRGRAMDLPRETCLQLQVGKLNRYLHSPCRVL